MPRSCRRVASNTADRIGLLARRVDKSVPIPNDAPPRKRLMPTNHSRPAVARTWSRRTTLVDASSRRPHRRQETPRPNGSCLDSSVRSAPHDERIHTGNPRLAHCLVDAPTRPSAVWPLHHQRRLHRTSSTAAGAAPAPRSDHPSRALRPAPLSGRSCSFRTRPTP